MLKKTETNKPVSVLKDGETPTADYGGNFREIIEPAQPASYQVELAAKSYILATTCGDICDGLILQWPGCMVLAEGFCAVMPSLGVLSTGESYGPTGKFRLWSRMNFNIDCENGKVKTATIGDRSSATGYEGPLKAPEGDFHHAVSQVNAAGEGILAYTFLGRPPLLVEPTFQALRPRLCPYIWHAPLLKITSCNAQGWSGDAYLGGSHFPTRKSWIDTHDQDEVAQGPIGGLWRCMGGWMVNGVFPSPYPL